MGWSGFPIPDHFVWPGDEFSTWAEEAFLRQFVEAYNERGVLYGSTIAMSTIERGSEVQSFWRQLQVRVLGLWQQYYVPSSFELSLYPTDADSDWDDSNFFDAMPPYRLSDLDD